MPESIWKRAGIPRGVRAVLELLRIDGPGAGPGEPLTEREWREALAFADRTGLTLLLGARAGERLPQWVRERIAGNQANNDRRLARQLEALEEIAGALRAAGLEFAVLKGITHVPAFVPEARWRHQCDLDLLIEPGQVQRAREVLLALGYTPIEEFQEFPTDHLPSMIRRATHVWSGDYFDPQVPLAVELHFRLWDEATERLPAGNLEEFRERRRTLVAQGVAIEALDDADALGYAALHVLRHLLRGSLKAHHVWELAYALDRRAGDTASWARWQALHSPATRRLEAAAFALARLWFGGRIHPAAEAAIAGLPAGVRSWFERYAASAIEALFRPNKHEIWLHLALLEEAGGRWAVLRRRLIPERLPGPPEEVILPGGAAPGWSARLRHAGLVWRRLLHHLGALPPLVPGAFHWLEAGGLARGFWRYLAVAALANLGIFVFTLLYNLHLLRLGYGEDFLGWIATAAIAGQIAGTLPAAAFTRRFGLRPLLLAALTGIPVISALRSLVADPAPLLALAGLGGVAFAFWVVAIAPVVSSFATPERRPAAFSLFFATNIALGVLGGLLGGWLPALTGSPDGGSSLAPALLVGCALSGFAFWPALGLRPASTPEPRRVFPRTPFVRRYLAALTLWSLATGAFNPFFNAYLASAGLAVEGIGGLFSASQAVQAVAVLLAPWVLARLGRVRGIVAMQWAAAAGLACLALGAPLGLVAAGYIGYMAFQWMTEPGMYAFLMDRVREPERTGASSLSYLVMFTCHAGAAALAGPAIARWGYPPVLAAAALLAVLAGALFRLLLARFEAEEPGPA